MSHEVTHAEIADRKGFQMRTINFSWRDRCVRMNTHSVKDTENLCRVLESAMTIICTVYENSLVEDCNYYLTWWDTMRNIQSLFETSIQARTGCPLCKHS